MRIEKAENNFHFGTRTLVRLAWLAVGAMLMLAGEPVASAQTPAPAATPSTAQAPVQSAMPASGTPSAGAQDITGTWQGTLHVPAGDNRAALDLRIVNKITKNDKGDLVVMDFSIDQGWQGMAATSSSFQDGAFKFAIAPIIGSYEGKMSADWNTITGIWTQGSNPLPLVLVRATPDTVWAMPERPKLMAADASPGFDVATIKPSKPGARGKGFGFNGTHFRTFNTNMNDLVAFAYGLHSKQIVDAPAWFDQDLFDIDGTADATGQPSLHQMELMVQKLLPDRFALKFHHEQLEIPVYIITVAPGGPKMKTSASAPNEPQRFNFRGLGDLIVGNMNMAEFATWMQSGVMDKPVVDYTGLTGKYDFTLKWTPDDSQFAQFRGTNGPVPPAAGDNPDAPPSLYTAVQETLGLKIEAGKAIDDVIVIDHVEKPSAN